jgi:hypothetical protein
VYHWFDITEYESFEKNNRHAKSPVALLIGLDKATLDDPLVDQIFNETVLRQWIHKKMLVNLFPLLMWFFIRLVYTAVCFILESDVSSLEEKRMANASASSLGYHYDYCQGISGINLSPNVKYILHTYLLIHSLCIILYDVIEGFVYLTLKRDFNAFKNLKGRKKLAVQYYFYRSCQCIMAITVCISVATRTIPHSHTQGLNVAFFLDLLTLITTGVAIWPLLYFLQLMPTLGLFILIIQRMMEIMFQFILVFVMLVTPFVLSAMMHMNRNSLAGCLEDFDGPSRSAYSMLRMMLDMVNLTIYPLEDKTVMYLMHTVYIFVVPILLLNFLIALMSNAVAEVANNKDTLMDLQRLSVYILLEVRLRRVFAPYYKWMQRKLYTSEDGRTYLVKAVVGGQRSADKEC